MYSHTFVLYFLLWLIKVHLGKRLHSYIVFNHLQKYIQSISVWVQHGNKFFGNATLTVEIEVFAVPWLFITTHSHTSLWDLEILHSCIRSELLCMIIYICVYINWSFSMKNNIQKYKLIFHLVWIRKSTYIFLYLL